MDGWFSHLINDGTTPTLPGKDDLFNYYETSTLKQNCIDIPWGPSPLSATVTTRDGHVKKGEELFTSYGACYWVGQLFNICGKDIELDKKCLEKYSRFASALKSVSVVYSKEAEELEAEFDTLL